MSECAAAAAAAAGDYNGKKSHTKGELEGAVVVVD